MKEENIAPAELNALLDSQKVIILDVRSAEEFVEGHLWGSLLHPVDSLPDSVGDISKESLIVTVCNKGGGRSERAAQVLKTAGWENVRWLDGGYLGWVEAGFPDYEPGFASS